ncbi:MAG TPA: RNA-directed DNA polymerase [Hyphomonadaceae bacterium]|nr:RNA-directed DNA polymerase [Hyphomonadaceae bacterium]
MTVTSLSATIDALTQEFVLVQAWKKASSYVRSHNWFSDTLALDRVAANLPDFIGELSRRLRSSDGPFQNTALRMVPAPKGQSWKVVEGVWSPTDPKKASSQLRPLAHVALADQVVTTAMMMCLADRVETAQGDPRTRVVPESRRVVTSYGNRLFCDREGSELRHRWGSAKLYRAYFQDYRQFLIRPEVIGDTASKDGQRVVILQSDLRQFYDRVSTELLHTSVRSLKQSGDDDAFFSLLQNVMSWQWGEKDRKEVQLYETGAGLTDFGTIALPQGLVASGFFANVVLLKFDAHLRNSLDNEVVPGIRVLDATRYVDDLRLVLSLADGISLEGARAVVLTWLKAALDETAPGLMIHDEKTELTAFRGEERPLIRQSRRMTRIQKSISAGLDVLAGGEVLDAVRGLVRAQQRLTDEEAKSNPFTPIPDVRDSTVDRFAAARFRTTFRSLRPLLWADDDKLPFESDDEQDLSQFSNTRTRAELDEEARSFAMELVGKWVDDPSNVRLLRVGLDLWPSPDLLQSVLALIRPYTEHKRNAPKRVALYCLAEIFRAGATETGFVDDAECLPQGVDIAEYRQILREEAQRTISLKRLPWYLLQQAYLMLATCPPAKLSGLSSSSNPEIGPYRSLIRFLLGKRNRLSGVEFATNAVIARRAFVSKAKGIELALNGLAPARLNRIVEIDPSFACEIVDEKPVLAKWLSARASADLGIAAPEDSLAGVVLSEQSRELLRSEQALLSFAATFLRQSFPTSEAIAPRDLLITGHSQKAQATLVEGLRLTGLRDLAGTSIYSPPSWVPEADRWKFQLGYLLRFILTAQRDFTRVNRQRSWKESEAIYRAPESHWYQRTYGLFNGHEAFGDDWLPITEWTEELLFGLLRWPGCAMNQLAKQALATPTAALQAIEDRLAHLQSLQGECVLLTPIRLPAPYEITAPRPLRACVVQTIYPGVADDFDVSDLSFNDPVRRRRHRQHLSAALAAVRSALALRETHKGQDGRLDWLILPELAVHPQDVRTHLLPFARAYRATILAGLTFQQLGANPSLVNSAMWIVPTSDSGRGLQLLMRRQGKGNLAPIERKLNGAHNLIRGFRPCQWLVGYQWSNPTTDPLWLTASVCYDATDIRLAADLKRHSDVFAVPALNPDVATFDHMALALHYHMFQMVIVANNGNFGGSNAYIPVRSYDRQIFHVYGQPQASITFFEIDDISAFKQRKPGGGSHPPYDFKPAPAGRAI